MLTRIKTALTNLFAGAAKRERDIIDGADKLGAELDSLWREVETTTNNVVSLRAQLRAQFGALCDDGTLIESTLVLEAPAPRKRRAPKIVN